MFLHGVLCIYLMKLKKNNNTNDKNKSAIYSSIIYAILSENDTRGTNKVILRYCAASLICIKK